MTPVNRAEARIEHVGNVQVIVSRTLTSLAKLKGVKSIGLLNTNVYDKEAAKLKAELPNTGIDYGYVHD